MRKCFHVNDKNTNDSDGNRNRMRQMTNVYLTPGLRSPLRAVDHSEKKKR